MNKRSPSLFFRGPSLLRWVINVMLLPAATAYGIAHTQNSVGGLVFPHERRATTPWFAQSRGNCGRTVAGHQGACDAPMITYGQAKGTGFYAQGRF